MGIQLSGYPSYPAHRSITFVARSADRTLCCKLGREIAVEKNNATVHGTGNYALPSIIRDQITILTRADNEFPRSSLDLVLEYTDLGMPERQRELLT